MIVAVAGVPGAWSSEGAANALRAAGCDSFVFSLGDVLHDLRSGEVTLAGRSLHDTDGIVVKKLGDQSSPWSRLRLHALRSLEGRGVRVFSSTEAIDRAMDRYHMTMTLVGHGLPVPATLAAELGVALRCAIAELGDAVVKPVYTSKGRGMIRVGPSLPAEDVGITPGRHHLVQSFVKAPGRDIGAAVVGGSFLGAFYRIAAPGEWQTTTEQGGRYAPCTLSDRGIEYAERAARAFGLDYTIVDLVEQGDDFLIYEVSAFGGFRGLVEACGIDAAAVYAAHVVRSLRGDRR